MSMSTLLLSLFLLFLLLFEDEESDSVPQTGEKKKEGRKSGILVLATNEFEVESEVRHYTDLGRFYYK